MPITKSAKKAWRQSNKRHVKNLQVKRRFKTAIKDFRNLITDKSLDKAKSFLPTVYKNIDKAAKKGVIKKNTASRYKSRLTKLLSKQK